MKLFKSLLTLTTIFVFAAQFNTYPMKRQADQDIESDKPTKKSRLETQELGKKESTENIIQAPEPIKIDVWMHPDCESKETVVYDSLQAAYKGFGGIKADSFDSVNEISTLEEIKQARINWRKNDCCFLNENKMTKLIDLKGKACKIIAKPESFLCIVTRKVGGLDQFTIASELRAIAEQKGVEYHPLKRLDKSFLGEKKDEKKDDLICKLSQSLAPALYELLESIAKFYDDMEIPEIQLLDNGVCSAVTILGSSPKDLIQLAIVVCAYLTNDELKFVVGHEMAHLYAKHNRQTSEMDNLSCSTTWNNVLSRAQETEADALALTVTNNPIALVSWAFKLVYLKYSVIKYNIHLFKQRIVALSADHKDIATLKEFIKRLENTLENLEDCEHPAVHERICYALSLLKK